MLVTIDTLRYDAALEPGLAFMRRLEREGVWFEQAYSASSFTSQVLVALLAAKLPTSVTMAFRGKLSAVPTRPVGGLVPWLAAKGYDTAFVGGMTAAESEYFTHASFLDGIRVNESLSAKTPPQVLIERALATYKALDARRPRFMWIHVMWVHEPQASRADYAKAVAETDAALTRLHTEIGGQALWIVTADHGEEFYEHGSRYHASTLFDEVVHVPLAVAAPFLPPARITQVTATRSLFPTLAAMTGPANASAAPGPYLCLLESTACRDQLVAMALELPGAHLHGLIAGKYKVIHDLNRGTVEAYDRGHDPGEQRPVTPSGEALRLLPQLEEGALGPMFSGEVWPLAQLRSAVP